MGRLQLKPLLPCPIQERCHPLSAKARLQITARLQILAEEGAKLLHLLWAQL